MSWPKLLGFPTQLLKRWSLVSPDIQHTTPATSRTLQVQTKNGVWMWFFLVFVGCNSWCCLLFWGVFVVVAVACCFDATLKGNLKVENLDATKRLRLLKGSYCFFGVPGKEKTITQVQPWVVFLNRLLKRCFAFSQQKSWCIQQEILGIRECSAFCSAPTLSQYSQKWEKEEKKHDLWRVERNHQNWYRYMGYMG